MAQVPICQDSIKDPAHALFICDQPELMQVREAFLEEVYTKIPEFKGAFNNAMAFFKAVLARREITPGLGKLAFNVLKIYDATPMLILEPPAHGSSQKPLGLFLRKWMVCMLLQRESRATAFGGLVESGDLYLGEGYSLRTPAYSVGGEVYARASQSLNSQR
ncbi:hypothetical protein B0H19DRAFT_1276136 [Mycena capillaripes]|nr:hypothetical protein B0H19DRAFT_1276136 [Mycena capillaripes]